MRKESERQDPSSDASSQPSEIDEALKIARDLREKILAGKGSVDSYLLSFQTVAHILGRQEELSWVDREINGYQKQDSFPLYRCDIPVVASSKSSPSMVIDSRHPCMMPNLRFSVATLMDVVDRDLPSLTWDLTEENRNDITFKITGRLGGDYRVVMLRSEVSNIIAKLKYELLKKLNVMISEITYGKIPQGIFRKFQARVNEELTDSNPEAVSELNIAYESLGKSEDPERISHVAFACRRLIKAVSDKLYSIKSGENKTILRNGKELDVGNEKTLNRLEAFVDSLDSENRKYLLEELGLLKNLMNDVPESINKGVHLKITNADAERLVLYSYMILGDIVLEASRDRARKVKDKANS